MEYTFNDWKKTLDTFYDSVEKDLEEIRKQKAEVLQIKAEIMNELNRGYYLRDDRRVVISAPEVIIGNVDKSGCLIGGGSTIIIRGNRVGIDGVGAAGSITTRAASIHQSAVDPGVDGNEAVVGTISEVVSQARAITIQSNNATDVFSIPPTGVSAGGVYIHADGQLTVDASQSSEWKKTLLQDRIDGLEKDKSAMKKEADDQRKSVEKIFSDIEDLYSQVEGLRGSGDDVNGGNDDVRSNVSDIQDLNDQIEVLAPSLYNAVDAYIHDISVLAEANRQLKSLKAEKDSILSGDDFKDTSTGASLSLRGECIGIVSADGDGNYRDNDNSGLSIVSNRVNISAIEQNGQLKENGEVKINAKTVNLSTANTKMEDDGKNGSATADGDIILTSKSVTIEAVDREIKDGEPKEKELTKEGLFSVRMEKTDFSATDTAGKATGSVSINSKVVQVKSMDVDKDKRTDDKLAEGSSMLLLSEKMYVGAKDKDNKSKKIQAVSEEMGLFADKTLEAQQGDAKAVLQLSGGNAAISGSKTEFYGDTTINGKAEMKDEVKAPKATIDNLEAKTSFKSMNISDGIAVPGAPSSASLSAKLKAEDLKDE